MPRAKTRVIQVKIAKFTIQFWWSYWPITCGLASRTEIFGSEDVTTTRSANLSPDVHHSIELELWSKEVNTNKVKKEWTGVPGLSTPRNNILRNLCWGRALLKLSLAVHLVLTWKGSWEWRRIKSRRESLKKWTLGTVDWTFKASQVELAADTSLQHSLQELLW